MITVSPTFVFFIGLLSAGIGYTLLKYSKDGDLDLRSKATVTPYATNARTTSEAWARLAVLANAPATEVTWNTSMFVAMVSATFFLSIVGFAKESKAASTYSIVWILSAFTVFGLQDTVQRWKSAHRKHALAAEQLSIMERLKADALSQNKRSAGLKEKHEEDNSTR